MREEKNDTAVSSLAKKGKDNFHNQDLGILNRAQGKEILSRQKHVQLNSSKNLINFNQKFVSEMTRKVQMRINLK